MGKVRFNYNNEGKWWDRGVVTLRKARAKKHNIERHKMQLERFELHPSFLEKYPNSPFIVDERVEAHRCQECYEPIYHGELYLEDKFLVKAEYWNGMKSYIHRICLECWKGPKFWL